MSLAILLRGVSVECQCPEINRLPTYCAPHKLATSGALASGIRVARTSRRNRPNFHKALKMHAHPHWQRVGTTLELNRTERHRAQSSVLGPTTGQQAAPLTWGGSQADFRLRFFCWREET